jgi:hypothetical protein
MKRRRPKKPTKHPPGSTGKIMTMRRHTEGFLLLHKDDERFFLPPDFDRAAVGERVRRVCPATPFVLD